MERPGEASGLSPAGGAVPEGEGTPKGLGAPKGDAPGGAGAPERLEWAVAPYRERPGRTVIVVAVIAAVGLGAYAAFQDAVLSVLAAALLAGSLRPYFARTRFVLDAEGAEFSRGFSRTRRAWKDLRSYYADRHGVTLSPFAEPSWLEPYRGLRLLFGGNRDVVIAFVAGRVPAGTVGSRRWSLRRKTAR